MNSIRPSDKVKFKNGFGIHIVKSAAIPSSCNGFFLYTATYFGTLVVNTNETGGSQIQYVASLLYEIFVHNNYDYDLLLQQY